MCFLLRSILHTRRSSTAREELQVFANYILLEDTKSDEFNREYDP